MSTYRVIRCPGCHQFTYTDYYGKWKLCPVCGEVISVQNVPVSARNRRRSPSSATTSASYDVPHFRICRPDASNSTTTFGTSAGSDHGMRLVRTRKDGRHVYYTLDDKHVGDLFRCGLEHVLHG